MKKMMAVLLAAVAMLGMGTRALANSWGLQSGVVAPFESPAYANLYKVGGDAASMANESERTSVLVMNGGDFLSLFLVEEAGGAWSISVQSLLALRQAAEGATPIPKISLEDLGERRTFMLAYEDFPRAAYVFAEAGGQWLLTQAEFWREESEQAVTAEWTEGGLLYRQGEARVLLPYPEAIALEDFVIERIPQTLADAQSLVRPMEELGGMLPWGRTVFLPEEKTAPVYQGPGSAYRRGAQGKAALSTREPFVALGEEDGWLLVGYRIGPGRMRFGYVEQSRLPGVEAEPLRLADRALTLAEEAWMTDDPMNERQETDVALPAGTDITYLGVYDGAWAYVEAVVDGVMARGFIPSRALLP